MTTEQHGIADISQTLYDRVTKYHAQIGHAVPKDTLQSLEWNLLSEAKALFHQKDYEGALNTFTHCLAVTEKTRSAKDATVRGAIVHNIASCLHNMGELEAAKAYYEQAIDAFQRSKMPVWEQVMYGDTNKRRIDFVRERLVDISWGRKPDGEKYLDENGRKKPVPPPPLGAERRGDRALRDEWFEEEPPPPPWALDDERRAAEEYPYDRRPAWLSPAGAGPGASAPPRARDDAPRRERPAAAEGAAAGGAATGGGGGAARDDAQEEQARKQWLQYYLQVGNWQAAEELIVSPDEQEDLEYLIGRERRLGRDVERAELHRDRPRDDGGGYGGDGAAAAPTPFAGDGHEEEETHEADFNELNPAAEAAAREEAAARASARAAPVDHVRRGVQRVAQYDDDDML